mmetsp:Transcript_27520/g.72696  ORF Transcript_27520/g.72696 Transcript_27520/m.72696 type:complete len:450 (+) Transcript_27520:499-1848(+)
MLWLQVAACCLLAANLQIAVVDLLVEAKYAQLMQETPASGADMVTWVWMMTQAGALVAACLVGPLSDAGAAPLIFGLGLPLAAQVLVPVAAGYLHDLRLPQGERGVRWDKLWTHPKLFALAAAMAAAAFTQALVLLAGVAVSAQLIYSLAAAAVLCVLSWLCLPRGLAICTLFLFLDAATYVRISGGLDYWFTAGPECAPGGPAFDYTYYSTYTQIAGAVASWVGVVLFQAVMAKWRLRTIFWTTTLIRVAASLFDVALVQRWNLAIGISDKAAYMLGDAVIDNLCGMLAFMPSVLLTSKLCPRELEATAYALLAGFQNFGSQVARAIGVGLMSAFDIRTEVPCEWSGLPGLVVTSHMVIPLVMLPLTFLMLPDLSPQDDLIRETALELLSSVPDSSSSEPKSDLGAEMNPTSAGHMQPARSSPVRSGSDISDVDTDTRPLVMHVDEGA